MDIKCRVFETVYNNYDILIKVAILKILILVNLAKSVVTHSNSNSLSAFLCNRRPIGIYGYTAVKQKNLKKKYIYIYIKSQSKTNGTAL